MREYLNQDKDILELAKYSEDYMPTMGAKCIDFNYQSINYTIWDTAGFYWFESCIVDGVYIISDYFLIFFDYSNPDNEESIQKWAKKIIRIKENCTILLLGIQKGSEKHTPQLGYPVFDVTDDIHTPFGAII